MQALELERIAQRSEGIPQFVGEGSEKLVLPAVGGLLVGRAFPKTMRTRLRRAQRTSRRAHRRQPRIDGMCRRCRRVTATTAAPSSSSASMSSKAANAPAVAILAGESADRSGDGQRGVEGDPSPQASTPTGCVRSEREIRRHRRIPARGEPVVLVERLCRGILRVHEQCISSDLLARLQAAFHRAADEQPSKTTASPIAAAGQAPHAKAGDRVAGKLLSVCVVQVRGVHLRRA